MAYPAFKAPEWQTGRVSALRQKFAAPQVGRLKRQMSGWMGMGYDPQAIQARRATIRGFGEGLGGIMGAAGRSALSQYGQEYGTQFRGAELGFGAEMEEERSRLAGIEAERGRTWRTEERVGTETWEAAERKRRRKWEAGQTKYKLTGEKPGPTASRGFKRVKGGSVTTKPYLVGEGGTASKPKPELVVYKGGRMELVGRKGPEVRTFPEKGKVIPFPKTKKILKRQYGGWVHGPEQEALRKRVESKKYRDILSGAGGRGGGARRPPMSDFLMNYLKGIKTGGAPGSFGQSEASWLLKTDPSKLFGILTYLQGGKPSFGRAGGSRGGGQGRITPEEPRSPTQYPGGGQAAPSLEYKAWLKSKYGGR